MGTAMGVLVVALGVVTGIAFYYDRKRTYVRLATSDPSTTTPTFSARETKVHMFDIEF
jgi:hypothetical protein